MAYRVSITDSALRDAEEYVRFIRHVKKEPQAAERWFCGVVSAIYSLEESPNRCPLIPEAEEFPFKLRHLIYHSHRIIFRTDEADQTVQVVRIYHGSRREFQPHDADPQGS